MTNEEIKIRYKNMDENVDRVLILSQLYACTQREIRKQLGLKDENLKTRDMVADLNLQGYTTSSICEKLGLKYRSVTTYLSKMGLQTNRERKAIQ